MFDIKSRALFSLAVIFIYFFSLASQTELTAKTESNGVHPLPFVSPKRADLLAKYIYAKQREWGTNCQFGRNIYYRHLQVWNGFYEEVPFKRSFEDFANAFDLLLDSIKLEGFHPSSPIPVGSNGVIYNGAHRLTACLLYHKNVVVEHVPNECSYGFDYFETIHLEPKYLDAMALQYCELKPDSFVMVILPSAVGRHVEIEQIINSYAEIVYRKEIAFTTLGGFNFVLTAYEHEPFVQEGKYTHFSSARHKAELCFPKHLIPNNPARVYLLQSDHLDLIKTCKAKIRALFNISNDSVHSTDTHQEAIVLARALFNKNSVHFLNHKKDIYFPQFEHYLEEYRNWLAVNQKEHDWFSVDSGAVLAAYGLRECADLDFLHYEKEMINTGIDGVNDHNNHLNYHALSLDDLLFDPDNYFFYKGIKCCSLSVLQQMKERRQEPKDIHDLFLINQLFVESNR